jgi:hypothetical protein
MTRTQINTDPATYAALAALALRLGYTQTRGPRVGEGSPVKLLEAIAQGELQVAKTRDSGASSGADEHSGQG